MSLVRALDLIPTRFGQWISVYLAFIQVDVPNDVPTDESGATRAEVRDLSIYTSDGLKHLDVGQVEVHLLVDLF